MNILVRPLIKSPIVLLNVVYYWMCKLGPKQLNYKTCQICFEQERRVVHSFLDYYNYTFTYCICTFVNLAVYKALHCILVLLKLGVSVILQSTTIKVYFTFIKARCVSDSTINNHKGVFYFY